MTTRRFVLDAVFRCLGLGAWVAGSIAASSGCSSSAVADARDASATEEAGSGPPADAGPGHVVYRLGERWLRVEATPGAKPEDIGGALASLSPGQDNAASLGPDGRFIALDTSRFACERGDCLGVATGDLQSLALVPSAAAPFAPAGRPSVAVGGARVVYPKQVGDRVDLFAVARSGDGWGVEVPLTATSPYPFHHDIVIAWDGTKAVFDCGPSQYQAPGTCVCEAHTDGTGFRKVLCPGDAENGTAANELHHPAYAPDGTIVFEADWRSNETVWRMDADGTHPLKVSPDVYSDDNSPCVLADGRIVSLWLGRVEADGSSPGLHEMKVMNADGSHAEMIVTDVDIVDVGMSCGL